MAFAGPVYPDVESVSIADGTVESQKKRQFEVAFWLKSGKKAGF
jgi:hypothetical protein